MDNLAKPTNRALFLVSVAVTGAFAGAAVWLFFFAMEHGIDYLWLFGGFCGRDSGIGPAQRAKTTIWN